MSASSWTYLWRLRRRQLLRRRGRGCPVQVPQGFPAFSPVVPDGGGGADVCACVATFVCWADGGLGLTTKGFPRQLFLSAVDGLFIVGVSCPPLPILANVNHGDGSCCTSLRRGARLAPSTKGFPASSPFASNSGCGANGRDCVAVVDWLAGCLGPNTNVFPLPPAAGGGHDIGGGPCDHVTLRSIALGGFPSSAPKVACGGR